jgi:hypothetical protein
MAENVIAIRAPQGQFDPELAATIVASIRPNPAYQAAITNFQQSMSNIALRGAMDRARIWREANAQIQSTLQQSYRNQQAAQDRAASQFSQAIRGVETYHNPSTGERVELTGGYSNAWGNASGEYILSNVPGFEPGQVVGGNWTKLNPARN